MQTYCIGEKEIRIHLVKVVAISVSPHVYFILVLILISMFLRKCIYELGIFHANQTTKCLGNQGRTKGEGWSTAVILLLARPKAALPLVILFFIFFLTRFIVVVSIVSICLVFGI